MVNNNENNSRYLDFMPEFFDHIQNTTDKFLENYNIHQAFVYLIAELFETTDEEKFEYTDGSKDGGIDFFIQDTQTFVIYQCKCPEDEVIVSNHKPVIFDKAPVQEMMVAIETLLDEQGYYDLKTSILRLRSDFQRELISNEDEIVLNANIAVFGELSPSALNLYQNQKEKYQERGIQLNLITWETVFQKFHDII